MRLCRECHHLVEDGAPEPHVCPSPEEIAAKAILIEAAAAAAEQFGEDELELFALARPPYGPEPDAVPQ